MIGNLKSTISLNCTAIVVGAVIDLSKSISRQSADTIIGEFAFCRRHGK
jgi:hypothetical protein